MPCQRRVWWSRRTPAISSGAPAAPSRCTPGRAIASRSSASSFGERGESQFAWKEPGATLDKVKAGRRDEARARRRRCSAPRSSSSTPATIRCALTEAHFDRMVDIYRELNPSFVLTHALEDPYNFDHPNAAHFAQETRVVAQAMGHKPRRQLHLRGAAGVPVRAAPAGDVQFQAAGDPQHRRGLGHQAQDLRDPRRAKASVGLLRTRRAATAACRAAATPARP